MKISWGHCQIHAKTYSTAAKQPIFWDVLSDLAEISHYDFEITSLNCGNLYQTWTLAVSNI